MVSIGNLRIAPAQRQVFVSGEPFQLGSRAFDVLEALIAARGQLVSKEALMRRVWPETVVVDNNLHVHICAIRKMLGEQANLLVAVPGRGYRLAIEAAAPCERAPQRVPATAVSPATPQRAPVLYGRDAALGEVVGACTRSRLVTLVGPGGIGKSRLASEAVRRLAVSFDEGVIRVIDLARMSKATDRHSVQAGMADVLAPQRDRETPPIEAAMRALGDGPALLLLDNCEHVVDAAADAVQALLDAVPACRIVATSREPLKVRGELVYKVAQLTLPSEHDSAEAALETSAVRLFLARARAVDARFAHDAQSISLVGELCRRLDGVPLAIELAASRAALLGIGELIANLDEGLQFLAGGYRTALPRHRTLRATLDWSYELLCENEQAVLRRLGVFPSVFGLEAITAVVSDGESDRARVLDAVCGLSEKSLLEAEFRCGGVQYRMLEASRAYARQKLADSGELEHVTRRYRNYVNARGPSLMA